MKKRLIIAILTAFTFVFLFNSCKKEADYVLQVGEKFYLDLYENPSSEVLWEWENEDKRGIVSMTRIYDLYPNTETILTPPDSSLIGNGGMTTFCFKGEKEGYVVVKMVYDKNAPEVYQKRLNFSIRVE